MRKRLIPSTSPCDDNTISTVLAVVEFTGNIDTGRLTSRNRGSVLQLRASPCSAIMDGPVTSATFRSVLQTCFASLPCQVIIAVVLVVLCQRMARRPGKEELFPVWATVEIAVASYFLRGDGLGRRIFSFVRRHGGSLFGIRSKHQLLINLPGLDRFMSQALHTLVATPVHYTLFIRVFGAADSPDLRGKLERSEKDLLAPVERLFLNDAAATALIEKARVDLLAAALVTFSTDPAHMKRWELSADVRVIAPDMAEANLQSLTRDFGACMAIPLLYGKDFVNRYPQLLDDFWNFDNHLFPLLMIGIPPWAPLRKMQQGRTARARILREMEAFYRRVDQHQRGERVDFDADMSDVSDVPFERNKVYEREGWTFAERGTGDLAILWGQNANTHPVLFWLLIYVYSTPGLLERLRSEVAPYVSLSRRTNPPDITSTDLLALSRNCPLLKASIFETYRMVNEPTSIRYVAHPTTVKDGELEHTLPPGTFVSVPHSLVNHDPTVFAEPGSFVPDRFLETDAASGKSTARYGRLRPWGAGAAMCKGRTFAEKEIMALGAAVISLWDIAPVGGTWIVPDTVPGTGVKKPARDVRVLLSRRRL